MQFAVIAGKGGKRVTDYILQKHHSYLSPFRKLVKGYGAPHANFSHIAFGTQLSFGNLLKGLK
jgi:hypothetical protein